MKKTLNLLLVLSLTVISFWGCKNDEEPKLWTPTPPIPGFEILPDTFYINLNADTTVVTASGTALFVPANCFARTDGDSIIGDITLTYREFHDAVDIYLAGIHMDFYAMGERFIFNTAGMFEIEANASGNELTFAEGKKIDLRFASQYVGDDYSFFYLNPESGAWEWIDLPEPAEINQEKIDARKALQEKMPKNYLSDEYLVLHYGAFLDIYFNNDYRKGWENRNNSAIRKHLSSYKFKMYKTKVIGEIRFLNSYYHPSELLWKDLDGKTIPKWTEYYRFDWKRTEGKAVQKNCIFRNLGNNQYQLTIKEDNKTFTKRMEVVMPLKNILRYKPEEWQKRYDDAMADLVEEQSRVDAMAETFRTFSINGLGIHNFDKLMKMDDWFLATPKFILNGEPLEPISVMIIFGDNSGFSRNLPGQLETIFRVNPESKHRIFVTAKGIDPSEIVYYPVENYLNWDIDSLRSVSKPEIVFELKSQKVASAAEVREALGFK